MLCVEWIILMRCTRRRALSPCGSLCTGSRDATATASTRSRRSSRGSRPTAAGCARPSRGGSRACPLHNTHILHANSHSLIRNAESNGHSIRNAECMGKVRRASPPPSSKLQINYLFSAYSVIWTQASLLRARGHMCRLISHRISSYLILFTT